MNIILCGAAGRMGAYVREVAAETETTHIVAAIDPHGGDSMLKDIAAYTDGADAIIDFSHHAAVESLLPYAEKHGIPAVIATTGHTIPEVAAIRRASETIPVFYSANMSVGVALLSELARRVMTFFPDADVEIVERHRRGKLDAPSGTALMLARAMADERKNAVFLAGRKGHHRAEPNEIGIHSLRIGDAVGDHEITIAAKDETLILRHEAHDRRLFARGALKAAAFLSGKPPGRYSVSDMLLSF